jgi:ABC-type glycerol-3-phosphate transport system substrate-binding protein
MTRTSRGRRVAAALTGLTLVATASVVAAAPGAGAYPKGTPMRVTTNQENYSPKQVVRVSVTRAQPGCKVKVVLSGNGVRGAEKVKVSAQGTAAADFYAPGAGRGYLVSAQVVTESCRAESASTTIDVIQPKVTGPTQVKAGAVVKLKAVGYPPNSRITWKVWRNGKRILQSNGTTNASGNAKQKVVANKKANYTVRATSGGFTDDFAFIAS